MKNISKIALFVLAALMLSMYSCKDDDTDEVTELTSSEAKAKLESSETAAVDLVNSLKNGEAANAYDQFFTAAKSALFNKEEGNGEWFDSMFIALEDVIDFDQMESEMENSSRFYFSNYTGLYVWDFAKQRWNKSASDQIIFQFPTEPTDTKNTGEFKISGYADTQVNLDGEIVYLPTALHISLTKNGTSILGFNINEMAYDVNEMALVTKLDIVTYVNPISTSYKYEKKSNTNYTTSYNITDGTNSIAASADLNTDKAITEDFSENNLVSVGGALSINQLALNYNVNLEKIIDAMEISETDEAIEATLNENVKAEITEDGAYIGKLFFQDENVYIVYADGTMTPAEEFFDAVIDQVEEFASQYEDDFNYLKSTKKKAHFSRLKAAIVKHTLKRRFKNVRKAFAPYKKK